MIEKLQSHYGFSRTPFRRSLAPQMLHRHGTHAEAVARIGWCVTERALGVITGEVGAGKTVAVRAALATLDTSRHTIIYPRQPRRRRPRPLRRHRLRPRRRPALPQGSVDPADHRAARRRRTRTRPHRRAHPRHYRPHGMPYTPVVLRDFRDVPWLFTDRHRNVRHDGTKESVWHDEW